jgi:AraC-like DNA-binding protein
MDTAGTPHSVRMVGAVQTRSVLIEPAACADFPANCRIVGVSALLRELLVAAAEIPLEYDEAGRDTLVMRLLIAEIGAAPTIPISVPFPGHPALATLCHAFLERPSATAHIDRWASDLAMNRRSFTRLFRRETGMSFAEWRQQACIAVALPRLAPASRSQRSRSILVTKGRLTSQRCSSGHSAPRRAGIFLDRLSTAVSAFPDIAQVTDIGRFSAGPISRIHSTPTTAGCIHPAVPW